MIEDRQRAFKIVAGFWKSEGYTAGQKFSLKSAERIVRNEF
jgi:hypothetical protein